MINVNDIYNVIPKNVINELFNEFKLNIHGIHGYTHWARVLENGFNIAKNTNANTNVIIAFAFFHDVKRYNDSFDPEHGSRGAELLIQYKDKVKLTNDEITKTIIACSGHTDVLFHDDKDINACWDADRLDLYRVGIIPNPEYLNNNEAIKMIQHASDKAEVYHIPDWAEDLLDDLSDDL
jgi:uncharacterized protein